MTIREVYVFTRSNGEWEQQTKLIPQPFGDRDRILARDQPGVSSDGSTVVFSTFTPEDPGTSAYVFTRSDGEWEQQVRLSPNDGDSEDNFGSPVGMSGDGSTAVIGAKEDKNPNGVAVGAAYVFTQSGSSWQQQSKLSADDGSDRDKFGHAVGLSGDGSTAIITAKSDNPLEYSGSAYVFVRSGGDWGQQANFSADGNGISFGDDIKMSSDGNTAIVREGRGSRLTRVFTRDEANWEQRSKLPDDGQEIETHSLGISGDGSTIIIGDDARGQHSAYVFE